MTDTPWNGLDSGERAYEDLRAHALHRRGASPPPGFGVLLQQGVAAFLVRIQRGDPVIPFAPPVPPQQLTPLPTDEIRGGIVRVLASIALARTSEVS